jgi:hypothetical protein
MVCLFLYFSMFECRKSIFIGCHEDRLDVKGIVESKMSAWSDTEFFHSEMQNFVRRQEQILKDPKGKFIIFQPVHTGLGNRIEGMVSTFLLAYFTDRAFIVNWDYYDPKTNLPRILMVEVDILDEPFPWSISLLNQFSSSVLFSLR